MAIRHSILCGGILMSIASLPATAQATVAAAKSQPNLTITAISAPLSSLAPDSSVTVTVTVANKGTVAAGPSTVGVELSTGKHSDPGAIPLSGSGAVPKLKRGATDVVSVKAAAPGWTPTGAYKLYACADVKKVVAESNENDNCDSPKHAMQLVANPLTVKLNVDSKHVASSILAGGMGTITTTDSRGNVYTLSVPAGALLGPERISILPVLSMSGLPWSKESVPVLGVRLEPSGLILNQTATLTISPAQAIAVANQHGLSFEGSGAQLHRMPVDPWTKVIQFDVSTPGQARNISRLPSTRQVRHSRLRLR